MTSDGDSRYDVQTGSNCNEEPTVNRQERIQRKPRRRPAADEISPLRVRTHAPDTSDADELLDRIAAILETM